jgi:hypothetical protein
MEDHKPAASKNKRKREWDDVVGYFFYHITYCNTLYSKMLSLAGRNSVPDLQAHLKRPPRWTSLNRPSITRRRSERLELFLASHFILE